MVLGQLGDATHDKIAERSRRPPQSTFECPYYLVILTKSQQASNVPTK